MTIQIFPLVQPVQPIQSVQPIEPVQFALHDQQFRLSARAIATQLPRLLVQAALITSMLCVLAPMGQGLSINLAHADSLQNASDAAPVINSPAATAPAVTTPIDIERFMRIRTPGAATIIADGTMYVRDWPKGVFQLFRVEPQANQAADAAPAAFPVAGPGATMTALTNFKDGLSSYSVSPDGKRILLEAAVGGNENDQISQIIPGAITPELVKTGDVSSLITPLLTNPKAVHSINLWLRSDDGFIYTANDESAEDFYIYRWNFTGPNTGTSTKILAMKGSWGASDISADGARMLVGQYRSISDTSMHELDVASGKLTDLTPKSTALDTKSDAASAPAAADEIVQTVAVSAIGYMLGDAAFLYESDVEDGNNRLFMRDLTTGKVTKPLPALDAYELDSASMNRERTFLSVSTNEDGYGVTRLYRLPSFEPVKLPEIERGIVFGAVRDDRFFFTLTNTRTPSLSYVWNIPKIAAATPALDSAAAIAAPQQITRADDQGIDLAAFPLPQLIRYESFDGLKVPAFVYLPPGAQPGTPVPFVVNYHGGPESQFRPGFDRTTQYLLSQGFGVMQPNVRGSTGYGRAFHMMDNYTKRWDSVRDGVAAAKYLIDSKLAAPGKISTWGGSYGGFMSVACLVEDSEAATREGRARYFGAGINQVGIVNLRTFLEQTSGYRRKLREAEYGPLSDPAFLQSVSPLERVDQIKVPMLIQHGLNDPRVPVGEALQLTVALQRRAAAGEKAIEPELLVFPDEGHGIAKLENRLLFARRMSAFLKRTIGPDSAPETKP